MRELLNFIELVGIIMVLPLLAVEALLKISMIVLFYPMVVIIAVFYPLLKRTKVLYYLGKYDNYAFKWYKGFYSSRITKYWRTK